MPHLNFLSSVEVFSGIAPWDWRPTEPFPAEILGKNNKKARDLWANNPKTISNFYTGYEALNENGRIRQGEEGNPPVKEHFLVADYDFPTSTEAALAEARKFKPVPNRLEKTMSGNWRAVWFLARPIIIPSYAWAREFKKSFKGFAFDPVGLLPGFDNGAWEAPERFWTNSGEWFALHDDPIPAERIAGWHFQASSKFNWKKNFSTLAIPAKVVGPELAKKYPRFADWPGEFELDSQGPTFWVDSSLSPKSAIVRETGMQTFSDHAGKGFFTWTELLGADFTKNYAADALGRAVENIYYDGKNYFLLEDKGWRAHDVSNISRALKVERGVSCIPGKDGVSDLDRTIRHIQRAQCIDGAAPIVCRRPGILQINGSTILNTLRTSFLAPAAEAQVWGPSGNFPWLSGFLGHFFDRGDRRQLERFLAWASHFYRSGITYSPASGLVAIIAGNTGTGKSFLVHGILGKLCGGATDVSRFLMGADDFGSENFTKAVWAIDDGKSSADSVQHKVFSENLKRAAANDTVKCHEKFRVPVDICWFGRVCVTLNKDSESMRMIPDLGISIIDKINLFHANDTRIIFPARQEQEAIVDRELPYFAAYLRDYVWPAHCVGTHRFGVAPWQDAEISGRAQQASPAAAFNEILDAWRSDYFGTRQTEAVEWRGTSLDLQRSILTDPTMVQAVRDYSITRIGRMLGALTEASGSGVTSVGKQHGKGIYRIARPDDLPLSPNKQQQK